MERMLIRILLTINQQFRILMGDRHDTEFRNDNWSEMDKLCHSFPRIFALARSKFDPMKDFGR